jgi:hypothetical protein
MIVVFVVVQSVVIEVSVLVLVHVDATVFSIMPMVVVLVAFLPATPR